MSGRRVTKGQKNKQMWLRRRVRREWKRVSPLGSWQWSDCACCKSASVWRQGGHKNVINGVCLTDWVSVCFPFALNQRKESLINGAYSTKNDSTKSQPDEDDWRALSTKRARFSSTHQIYLLSLHQWLPFDRGVATSGFVRANLIIANWKASSATLQRCTESTCGGMQIHADADKLCTSFYCFKCWSHSWLINENYSLF